MLASFQKSALISCACLALAVSLSACGTDTAGTPATTPTASLLPKPPTAETGLVGWEPNAILTLYGKPQFVRKEKESELWRYDGAHCNAFFFFYQEQTGLRVRHVEMLPQGQGAIADAACLAGIKARAAATS